MEMYKRMHATWWQKPTIHTLVEEGKRGNEEEVVFEEIKNFSKLLSRHKFKKQYESKGD